MTTIITYSETNNTLTQTTNINDTTLITIIDIQNETIQYPGSDFLPLSNSDIYLFKSIIDNLQITDQLIVKLTNMNFIKNIFLPTSVGPFNTNKGPFNYFFIFSSLIIPYQIIDLVKSSQPKYSKYFQNAFNKNNNVPIYYLKEFCRYILVIPGLLLSPMILITSLFALKKMT